MKESFTDIINANTPTLVDFYADWCGPCQAMAPILKELARELNGKARIIKIDIDRNPAVASHYQVQAVPTLILFKNGQIRWKGTGLMPMHQLKQILLQHI